MTNPAEQQTRVLLEASQLLKGVEAEDEALRTNGAQMLRHLADLLETDPDSLKAIAILSVEKVVNDGVPGCQSQGTILGGHEALAALFIQLTPLVNQCMFMARPILEAAQNAPSHLQLVKG